MSTVRVRLVTKLRRKPITSPDSRLDVLIHRGVIGLKVGSRPALNFPESWRWGDKPRVDEINMPIRMADRLEEFAELYYMEGLQGFNCHSFMWFLMGWSGSHFATWRRPRFIGQQAGLERLEPFRPYTLFHGGLDGEERHSGIAIGGTTILSVLGDNRSLVVTRLMPLLDLYDADTLMRVERVKW